MKKLFSIYLAMLMAFSGAVTVFASPPADTVAPYFISIYNVSYTFNICLLYTSTNAIKAQKAVTSQLLRPVANIAHTVANIIAAAK